MNEFSEYVRWKWSSWKREANKITRCSLTWYKISFIAAAYFIGIHRNIFWGIVMLLFSFLFWIYFDFTVHRSQWKGPVRKEMRKDLVKKFKEGNKNEM